MEAARSMLHASNIHIKFWGEAVNSAIYILNMTGTRTLEGITPSEAWYGTKPSIAHIRVFGSDAYYHVLKETRHKLMPKAKKAMLMGYSDTSKAYRLWDINSRKIVESRDVLFDETPIQNLASNGEGRVVQDILDIANLGQIAPLEQRVVGVIPRAARMVIGQRVVGGSLAVGDIQQIILQHGHVYSSQDELDSPTVLSNPGSLTNEDNCTKSSEDLVAILDSDEIEEIAKRPREPQPPIDIRASWVIVSEHKEPSLLVTVEVDRHEVTIQPQVEEELQGMATYVAAPQLENAPRSRRPPQRHGEWIYLIDQNNYACAAFSTIDIPDEPESFEEAMRSPQREQWKHAMNKEFDSLMKNGTWEYQELPKERKTVKNKWVYKVKLVADGSVDHYKARLVAKGFT